MEKKDVFTKALAVAGTILVWLPILSTLVTSMAALIIDRVFRFDYLMPAEFFPVALVGAGLLLWAALWVHSRRALIGWGSGAMIAFLAGGQALAVATGLASGRIKPVGLVFGLVVASLVLYCLALIEVGVTGIFLWQDIFRGGKKEGAPNALDE